MLATNSATWIIAGAAAVQALTAILIWRLTRGLVTATRAYADKTAELVEKTEQMARETKRANDLSQQAADRALQAQAPILAWAVSNREHDDRGNWRFAYSVRNFGISP